MSRKAMSRTPMTRNRKLAAGALVLLLAVAPFLPRGADDPDGSLESASVPSDLLRGATAGRGAVTAAMRQEIERVVARGGTAPRCADFEGQRYCIGEGWTTRSEAEIARDVAAARTAARGRTAGERTGHLEHTGDLDAAGLLARRGRMDPAARARADRAELTEAAAGVAKVWLLRHQIQGVPLPDGFLERHPEIDLADRGLTSGVTTASARTATTATTTSPSATTGPVESAETTKTSADYPEADTVLHTSRVAEQTRSYWCGPTSMQMIEWGWTGTRESQSTWARRLETTTSGTAISDMVSVTNRYTGWDREDRAGAYITLDISDWTYSQWWLLQMRHYHDYRAPIILHPILLKRWYPYLDDDASGHFQVGRGYDKNGADANTISYFEPWNQRRFDPSEPYIERVQWRSAYRSYRANQEHFQHNLGV
jgi:hypothetical protein